MDRVTVDELHELMGAERVGKVIDVRSPMSQALTGRIPGAITVDPKNLHVELLAVEPESEVIVYCACPNEYTAVKVAKALMQHGFKRVRPLHGGIDAWIAAGHPVESRRICPVLKSVSVCSVRTDCHHEQRRDPDEATRRRRIGPYSQAIRAGNTVYLSGQIGLDPATGAIVEGIEAQAHQVFANLRAVAQAAGGDLDDIVKLSILMVDLADFAKVNEIMATYFTAAVSRRARRTRSRRCRAARLIEIEGDPRAAGRAASRRAQTGARETFDQTKGQ